MLNVCEKTNNQRNKIMMIQENGEAKALFCVDHGKKLRRRFVPEKLKKACLKIQKRVNN